jgi:hypothetical protein
MNSFELPGCFASDLSIGPTTWHLEVVFPSHVSAECGHFVGSMCLDALQVLARIEATQVQSHDKDLISKLRLLQWQLDDCD